MSVDGFRIRRELIAAYNLKVDERDRKGISDWKLRERERFHQMLKLEGKSTLIDIGCGTGTHAIYFKGMGIDVTCLDLSPMNVARCQQKGLVAHTCDVLDLRSLGRLFDSAFAMNSLLHIPRCDLRQALSAIADSLNPAGLFYWGQYGGVRREGVYADDHYEPKRFFSLLEDGEIQEAASDGFTLERFATVSLEPDDPIHYQSLILRVLDRHDGAA